MRVRVPTPSAIFFAVSGQIVTVLDVQEQSVEGAGPAVSWRNQSVRHRLGLYTQISQQTSELLYVLGIGEHTYST